MRFCAAFDPAGAACWRVRSCRGFTLLEICMVLLIIMILLAATMPSIQSAFVEQAMRNDTRQLALMVRTAMLQSEEQHRVYVMDLTSTSMDLYPAGNRKNDEKPSSGDEAPEASGDSSGGAVSISGKLDRPNIFVVPDSHKPGGWEAMPATSWIFKPGNLCPATKVRLVRGQAWLELNFNGLTGNVESESAYIP